MVKAPVSKTEDVDSNSTVWAKIMNNKIKEAIENYWGPRCPNFNSYCHICEAWKEYDDAQTISPSGFFNTGNTTKQGYYCCKCDRKLSLDADKRFYCASCD